MENSCNSMSNSPSKRGREGPRGTTTNNKHSEDKRSRNEEKEETRTTTRANGINQPTKKTRSQLDGL